MKNKSKKKTKKNIRQEIIDKYGDDNFLFMNPPEDFDRAINWSNEKLWF